MGELRKRVRLGEKIPPGVMLDGQGHSNTNFKKFTGPPKGVLLPFAGYKGSGLHLMAEILGGILKGNGLGKEWWERGGPAINGLMLQAIRIEEFFPLEEFYDKIEELVVWIKSKKTSPGFSGVTLPGENSKMRAIRNLKEGIEIEAETWERISQCAAELGVEDTPLPFSHTGPST